MSILFVDYAVYNGNAGGSTALVISKLPNALGIYGMSGNVWVWCFDWYPGLEGSYRVRRGVAGIMMLAIFELAMCTFTFRMTCATLQDSALRGLCKILVFYILRIEM
jgi:hypothetical protein